MSKVNAMPVVNTMTVAGKTMSLSNIIELYASADAAKVSAPSLAGAATGYQVPVGKSLRVRAVIARGISNAAIVTIGYCDNDVGKNSGISPTNLVYPAGYAASFCKIYPSSQLTNFKGDNAEYSIDFVIPATKFLYFSSATDYSIVNILGELE